MNGDVLGSEKVGSRKRASFKISVQITAVVLTIFIIASVAGLFIFRKSLDGLTENSKDKVVESVASLVSSTHDFVARMILYIFLLESGEPNYDTIEQSLRQSVNEGKGTSIQVYVNGLLSEMVDSGINGLDVGYFAIPPTPGENDKAVVAASNSPEYIFEEVPDEVAALIEGDKNYKLFEDGIREMGLEGEYLVTSYKLTDEGSDEAILWYFDFKPMDELLAGIDSFYQKESRSAMLWLSLTIGLSIIGLIIISFLVLGHLIKRRITGPIEELSGAAEKVVDGDMNVRVEIKPREEFSELKHAFNQMISSISAIVSKTVARQAESEKQEKAADEKGVKAYLKPRSTILFQVIALFTIIFIGSGLFFMFSISSSMNSMVDKSKESLIEAEAEIILSGHEFGGRLAELLSEARGTQAFDASNLQELVSAISEGEYSSYQRTFNEMLGEMIEGKLYDYALVYSVYPPSPITDDYTVILSSDDKFMYTKPPDEILEFFEEDEETYTFFPDGIPEMGFDEPFLATSWLMDSSVMTSTRILLVDFTPMGEEVEALDDFYDKESNKLLLTMSLVIGISILIMILITVLALTYLIRNQITGPIDELVVVANQVMEGDLDVQVKIRPGEELEGLKTAFNKMIGTLRDLVEQSMGG